MNILHICANPRPIEESASKTACGGLYLQVDFAEPGNHGGKRGPLPGIAPPYLSLDGYRRFWMPGSRTRLRTEQKRGHGHPLCQQTGRTVPSGRCAGVDHADVERRPAGHHEGLDRSDDQPRHRLTSRPPTASNPCISCAKSSCSSPPAMSTRKAIRRDGITPVIQNAFGQHRRDRYRSGLGRWPERIRSTPDSAERKQFAIEAARKSPKTSPVSPDQPDQHDAQRRWSGRSLARIPVASPSPRAHTSNTNY
jgi:hypothetical protein